LSAINWQAIGNLSLNPTRMDRIHRIENLLAVYSSAV
jgi:hypothetical protein